MTRQSGGTNACLGHDDRPSVCRQLRVLRSETEDELTPHSNTTYMHYPLPGDVL